MARTLALALVAGPAAAQTGQVRGKVVDAKNQPVEGATVTIEMIEGMTRKYQVKTNRRGEFNGRIGQAGEHAGRYAVLAGEVARVFEVAFCIRVVAQTQAGRARAVRAGVHHRQVPIFDGDGERDALVDRDEVEATGNRIGHGGDEHAAG